MQASTSQVTCIAYTYICNVPWHFTVYQAEELSQICAVSGRIRSISEHCTVWKSLLNSATFDPCILFLLIDAPGVEVKAICPSWADTEIVSGVDGDERKVNDHHLHPH